MRATSACSCSWRWTQTTWASPAVVGPAQNHSSGTPPSAAEHSRFWETVQTPINSCIHTPGLLLYPPTHQDHFSPTLPPGPLLYPPSHQDHFSTHPPTRTTPSPDLNAHLDPSSITLYTYVPLPYTPTYHYLIIIVCMLPRYPYAHVDSYIPYSRLFLWGANFRYFRGSSACHENLHPRK